MPRAYIIGNGGHARVIASFLDCDVTFVVQGEPANEHELTQSHFDENMVSLSGDIYIGIGSNSVRQRIFEKLVAAGRPPAICVAPNAFVARDATLETGAVICAGAVIGSGAHIGPNTIVNTLSSVDHDCVLGEHSQITVGVTLGGTVHIGRNCFFGLKSAAVPNISVGDGSQVRAGSLLIKSVPPNVLVGGSPAKIVRSLAVESA